MIHKITMSIENSQNLNSIKEIRLNKSLKKFSCITEFKKRAILKFCKENGTKSCQYEEIINSNVLSKIGLY